MKFDRATDVLSYVNRGLSPAQKNVDLLFRSLDNVPTDMEPWEQQLRAIYAPMSDESKRLLKEMVLSTYEQKKDVEQKVLIGIIIGLALTVAINQISNR